MKSTEVCPNCGGPLANRQLYPYPVVLQILFGASFVAFLIFLDRFRGFPTVLWAWSGVQITLGLLLIRGRMRAKIRVLRCIRCEPQIG